MPRPELLYLVHRLPYPPDKGDRIRAYHLLRFLSQRANVSLACLADEPVPDESVAELRRWCRQLAIIPLDRRRRLRALASFGSGGTITEGAFSSPELRDVLHRWTSETQFDAVLAYASSMAPYLDVSQLRRLPAVVDLVDVDSQKWFDYAAASRPPRKWLYSVEGRRLRRLEGELAGRAKALTLVGAAEAEIYRSFCQEGIVRGIPNGVDLDYFQPAEPAGEPSCVFVGALDYRPNVDGACWFVREVWPEVHRRRPEAKLYLVGRRPAPAVVRLAEVPGVEVVGQVPDVRPYLARTGVSVNPLQIVRGIQNKVLEALAMSKATIGSPEALTGLAVEPEVHVLSASTAPEWTAAVLRLFDDAALRRRLGEAGRRYVEEHHCWESCLEPFAALLGLNDESAAPWDRLPACPVRLEA